MWSQCRWVRRMLPSKGRRSQKDGDLRSPVPGIEQQGGRHASHARRVGVERERDARRVAAVANELGPGGRSRSASTAKMDPHPLSIAPDLRGGAPPRAPRDPSAPSWSASTIATRHGVTAASVDVRAPSSRWARSPRSAPGPYSARRSPSCSTRMTPSRTRKTSVPGSPCLRQDGAGREALDLDLAASAHDPGRERALERGLDRRHERLGVLVAPRACAGRTTGGTSP